MEIEIILIQKHELEKMISESIRRELAGISAPKQEIHEVLTTDELLKVIKVSRSHLLKLRKEGLPCYKIGDSVRYKKDEVIQFINSFKSKKASGRL